MAVSGGSELNAVRTASALRMRGHHVTAFTLTSDTGGMSSRYEAAGIPVRRFPIDSLVGRRAMHEIKRASAELADSGFDLVHTHDLYSNLIMVLAARVAGVPVIASKRWIQYSHRRHLYTDRLAYRLASRVLVNSREVGESAHREQGVPAHKLVVIPNFVDAEVFDGAHRRPYWRTHFGFNANDRVLGVVAQLRPEKNHGLLLRVFNDLASNHSDLKLLIVGDGELRAGLERLVAEYGLSERVVLAGHVERAWQTFAAIDVAVLPSQHEGFPNSLIEAMAVGVPIVASDVGGIRDAIRNGDTGWLAAPGDYSSLHGALSRSLADTAAAAQMADRAREAAAREYSQEAVMARLESLYLELCQTKRR